MPGGRIDIEVAPDLKGFNTKLESGLRGAVGVASKIGGLIGVGVGAGVAFQKVISIGNDYTNTLNTMQAVSQATADQMAAVGQRAKELGNDASLPNASASDAAAAMTELAKGGFSVQQSMDAAKGTLQLAAAAQIDAASAATIQSQALQAFGLDAGNAAHVADVLANVSNASSGEMTDFAYGLQQAGTVANGFGVSIEDTSATLGMLANAGISGSDAGTLLKTSLLALTDQGKPAQAAIEELGLKVYDAQGKFIGMRSLLEQLKTASGKMSEEQYQAATATLFGSDAMRMASIAAENGVASFDNMRAAVDRQGAAAEVAAAKTQGLPGAISKVQNSAENLALELYDLIDGPLESFAKGAAEKIEAATPVIVDGLSTAGDAVATVGKSFLALPGFVQVGMGALAAIKGFGLDDTAGSFFDGIKEKLAGFRDEMEVQKSLASESSDEYSNFGDTLSENEEQIGNVAAAFSTLEARSAVVGKIGEGYRSVTQRTSAFADRQRALATATGGLGSQFRLASANVASFAGVVGGAAVGAARGFGQAAKGIVNALGGPWALGFTAVTMGVTAWMSSVNAGKAATQAYEDSIQRISKSQSELGDIFARSKGSFDDLAIANMTSQVTDLAQSFADAAETGPRWNDYFSDVVGDINPFTAGRGYADDRTPEMERRRDAAKAAQGAIEELGMTDQQVAQAMADDSTWSAVTGKLREMGDGGIKASDDLNAMRQTIMDARTVAQNTTPGFFGLSEAVKTLADDSASAADRTSALKTALDILSGKPVDVGAAMQSYNRQVRDTAEATQQAWDQTQGWAQALKNADGSVNTSTTNGDRLLTSLSDIKEATLQAAASGADMAPIWAQNEEQFKQLAAATGLQADEIRRMAEQAGLVPKDIGIFASLKGADSVEQQLTVVRSLLQANAEGIEIPVEALTPDALARLDEVGVKIDKDINGKPGIVKLTAPNQAALDAIQTVIDKIIPNKTFTIIADSQGAEARLRAFGAANIAGPLPAVQLGGNADGGRLPAFAGGGRMPATGPGTERTDGIYAVTKDGRGIAMVDGEEWVINSDSSDRYDRELAMINAGTFPKLPGFESGGRIASQRAHAGLAPEAGKPYGYGQVGNPSWDCSSYSSLAYALLKGLDGFTRWYTTESDFPSLGFRPGMGPSSALNIGVHNGGGGPNSHMTSMLDGVPFESNSDGVKYGSGASRPDDQQYEKQFHLPASAFNPPGDGSGSGAGYGGYGRSEKKATWTEKDELSLDSARIAITQAQEARERTNGNPKKTQADRDQAESKVARAEERVRSLEAKKRAAETGANATPAPPAPELTSSLTDDEIQLKELQWSIDEADAKRNEVYDDPEATDRDRERADADLQKAINSLAAAQKEQRGDSSTIGDILGNAAKSAVTETLGGTLDFFGVPGEKILSLTASDAGGMLQATPRSFSDSEIAKQGPEVPGTPEWAKAMIDQFNLPIPSNTMPQELLTPAATPGTQQWADEIIERIKVPTFLRDMGGALPNGAAALNLSGDTEWVQTAADRRRYEVDMRDLAALRAGANGGGVSPSQLDSMLGELQRITARPSGPLVNIEQMVANNDDEAAHAMSREARRLTRSDAFVGGWG
ncbi:phage tail tape measure protein [Rhodococcus sp. BE178]|uniref:phage tail tape measure protein n=1 Tax=Rhodococcus sp. BE178 TaxID=2817737 RepID=UPI003D1A2D74